MSKTYQCIDGPLSGQMRPDNGYGFFDYVDPPKPFLAGYSLNIPMPHSLETVRIYKYALRQHSTLGMAWFVSN